MLIHSQLIANLPPEKPLYPVRLLINGHPPVYTPALKVKIPSRMQYNADGRHQDLPESHHPFIKGKGKGPTALDGGNNSPDPQDGDTSDAEDGLARCVQKQAVGELQEFEDENQPLPTVDYGCNDEGEEELTRDEIDIWYQVTELAVERDEVPESLDADSEEDSDIDTNDNGNDSDYIPNAIRGKRGKRGMGME